MRAFSFHQTEQEPASASSQRSADSSSKLPPAYFSNAPRYRSTGALNVLLLDALNSTLLNQASMRDGMIKLIEKLPAGQPIAIYLLGNKLTLVQDFTSDPEVLRKAVASVKRQGSKLLDNTAGTTRMDEMRVPRLRLEEFHDQHIAAEADFRVRFTLDALNSLGRYLAGYPGRKNLVWVSETFPFSIVLDDITSQHGLTFELGHDGLQHASVDCAVIVYSEKNEPVKSLSNTMIAALKPEEYQRVQQKSFPCRQTFDLAPGEYLFRQGVRDSHAGTLGTLNAPVTIPSPSQASQAQPPDKKP